MARSFNGSTDKIVGASVTPINFNYNNPFSVAGWGYLTDFSYNCLVGHLDTASGFRGWELSRSNSSGGILDFFLVNSYSATAIEQSMANVPLTWGTALNNIWVPFGVTYSGSGIASGCVFYLQGINAGVATASFNSLAGNTTTNTIPPRLGQRIDGTIPIAAGGALSDVAIWNVILTAREMLELSLGRRAGTIRPESIVSYWPLGGTESPEPDLSVNANYGTLTGTKFAFDPLQMQLAPDVMPMMPMMLPPPPLRQKHFRFRTDTGAADATPTWGALEDTN